MKTKVFLWIACLAHFFCAGQSYFDNYYKTGYDNIMSTNVLSTPDSGCVFVNYIQDSATGRQDLGLIKLDAQGNEVVKKSFNIHNLDYLTYFYSMRYFIPATPCSYFMSGATFTGNGSTVILNKINRETLDTMKTYLYSDGIHTYNLNNFVKLNDNKYFLIGNKFNSINQWPVIFQLDSNLKITNTINLTSAPLNFGCYNALYNPITKKILLEGFIPSGNYPNTFIHIDTLGVINKIYTSVSSRTTAIGQVFYSSIDTSYVCIGSKTTDKYSGYDLTKLCITKYDKYLRMRWQKTYGENALANGLADAVILPDGSIVASGSYSKLTSLPLMNADHNGVILKVDKDGHFKWMQEYSHHGPGNYREYFYGVDTTPEGGFILCGNVMSLPRAQAWAVKTDGYGCVIPGCASSTVSVDSLIIGPLEPPDTSTTVGIHKVNLSKLKVFVYPNPVQDLVIIEVKQDELTRKATRIKLTDLLGSEIKTEEKIVQDNYELNLETCKPGIYFVQVFEDDGLISTHKIIKE